jgi:G-patch domain
MAASFYSDLVFGEEEPPPLKSEASDQEPIDCDPSDLYFCEFCEKKIRNYQRESHLESVGHLLNLFNEEPSQFYAISKSNRGYQMLKKLGWTEERGLGKNRNGMLGPLKTQLKNNRKGLGTRGGRSQARVTHFLAHHPELEEGTYSTAGVEKSPPPRERTSKREVKIHRQRVEGLIKARDQQLKSYLRT